MTQQEIQEQKAVAYYKSTCDAFVVTSAATDLFIGAVSTALLVASCVGGYGFILRAGSALVVIGVMGILIWNKVIIINTLSVPQNSRSIRNLSFVFDWVLRACFVMLLVLWVLLG
jgi:hypothetical protein